MFRVLLTGRSGYLGEAVFAALAGRYHVTSLAERLQDIVPGSLDFDCVIHVAGALRHRPAEHHLANVLGTARVLAGLRQPTPIVYVSSRGVYAPTQEPLTESSPVPATDSYGRSKWDGEVAVVASGNPYLILRPTGIYGWSVTQAGLTFPTQALAAFVEQRPVSLFLPDRPHDYLYVHDLARWIVQLLPPGPHWNQVYNAAGEVGSLTWLVEHLAREFEAQRGLPTKITFTPGPPARAPVVLSDRLHARFAGLRHTPVSEVLSEMVSRFPGQPS